MTTLLNGLLGGLLVGLVAGGLTQFLGADAATQAIFPDSFGGEKQMTRWRNGAVQVVYGGLGGVVLVALELYGLDVLAVPPTVAEAFGIALVWSGLLFGLLVVLWRAVTPSLDRSQVRDLLVYHLIYGLGFGVWIRLTWIT